MSAVARDRDGLDRVIGESRRAGEGREDKAGKEKSRWHVEDMTVEMSHFF
jgi:hypothetical protein